MNEHTEERTVIAHVVVAVPLKVRVDENGLAVEVIGQAAPAFVENDLSIDNPDGDAFIDYPENMKPGDVSCGKWRMADEEEYDAAVAIVRQGNID